MNNYINVTQEAGKRFYQEFHDKGKIVMLNMLKFKSIADYTNLDALNPGKEITGKEAYQLYMDYTLPRLEDAGSKILYYGKSSQFVIGPESESWDAILLVEHQSVAHFMSFAQNETYLKYAGHRAAALEDSRLLPSIQK